mmetsp:Transcript_18223/g.31445  ORF Transcript_18223/g.31445 Transcript_18223/m.31445 type:complete len:271 (-) Transcript_18223:497-1309(-)
MRGVGVRGRRCTQGSVGGRRRREGRRGWVGSVRMYGGGGRAVGRVRVGVLCFRGGGSVPRARVVIWDASEQHQRSGREQRAYQDEQPQVIEVRLVDAQHVGQKRAAVLAGEHGGVGDGHEEGEHGALDATRTDAGGEGQDGHELNLSKHSHDARVAQHEHLVADVEPHVHARHNKQRGRLQQRSDACGPKNDGPQADVAQELLEGDDAHQGGEARDQVTATKELLVVLETKFVGEEIHHRGVATGSCHDAEDEQRRLPYDRFAQRMTQLH